MKGNRNLHSPRSSCNHLSNSMMNFSWLRVYNQIGLSRPTRSYVCISCSSYVVACTTQMFLCSHYLINGVPLGIDEDILPSKCFPINQSEAAYEPPLLSVHHTNWQSAEDDPSTVQALIDKEVDAGWVSRFDGSLEDAQAFFQHGLAVGKLGLALSDTHPPRLVLDSTMCGVNPQSRIPEKTSLPTARDVVRSYPLRQSNKQISGVSFDVKSAHKQMAVHPRYRGFLCFQFQGQIYFYKVCPFGAVVSAHFWSRLGGAFQRLFHRFCYLPHASLTC